MTTLSSNILTLQELLAQWRDLGTVSLPDGRELIGELDCGHWMHTVWPGVSDEELEQAATRLDRPLPTRLRVLWSRIGGLSLFSGGFQLAVPGHASGLPLRAIFSGDTDAPEWLEAGSCVLACNAWDGSLHVLEASGEEITRRDPDEGLVIDRHSDALAMVAHRLSRIDELQLAAACTAHASEDAPPTTTQDNDE